MSFNFLGLPKYQKTFESSFTVLFYLGQRILFVIRASMQLDISFSCEPILSMTMTKPFIQIHPCLFKFQKNCNTSRFSKGVPLCSLFPKVQPGGNIGMSLVIPISTCENRQMGKAYFEKNSFSQHSRLNLGLFFCYASASKVKQGLGYMQWK